MFRTKTFVVPAAISILAGCSYLTACGSDDENQTTFNTEDGGSTGGSGNGGSGTGGRAATGGRSATGGRGGAGGSPTGGAQNTGGANAGGASTGGAQNTGGANTGGAQNTGGANTGGAQNTGGANTGGAQNTGGVGPDASAGGSGGAGTGGAGTGGAGTGGAGTGGAGTGGAGTGGAGTGGAGTGGAGTGGAGGTPEGGLCGNDVLDPGEECDPPSAKFCTAACKLGGTCTQCENDNCSTVVTDCTQGTNGDICIAALQCSRANDCYRDDPANCYCGTVDFVSCQTGATAPDGPCVTEFNDAASSTSPGQLLLDLTDPSTALGRAGFIMQCDKAFCNPSNGSTACWAP
jgi:hypothetical protein